ncbi:MAG TPA: ABC transporter ATP-binding protein [Clostridiales bacterium]|nr:ABC transporter ATP-binding protein [Clostridiales bacterium]
MDTIKRIFSILTSKQRKYSLLIILMSLMGAILEAIGIGAIWPLISIMSDPFFLEKHNLILQYVNGVGIYSHTEFIVFCSVVLIAFYMVKNLFMVWQTKMQITFSLQLQIQAAKGLLGVYLNKPYEYYLNHNSSTLFRNVDVGSGVVFSQILVSVFALITEAITACVIWLLLLLVDSFTAIIVAGAMGIMMYGIITIFRKKLTRKGKEKYWYSAIYLKWLNQAFASIKETKVFRKENFFLREFNEAYNKFGVASSEYMFLNQLPRMMIEAIVISCMLLLIIGKILMGISAVDIVPLLGVLALAAFRLMPSSNRIVSLYNSIRFNMTLFNEMYDDLINAKEETMQNESPLMEPNINIIPFNKEIKVSELGFSYDDNNVNVLDSVSFIIPQGCFVGIVGKSGSGKTTFVDILLGLLKPSKGHIYSDGIDINSNIRAWQKYLSYVPQNIYLIDGSIKDNITLSVGIADIEDEKLNNVLKMAEIYDFVQSLQDGVNTSVGERGVKLSGGQRQRLGIARALYSDPKILVLDEATSALDKVTEDNITKTILRLKGEITIIAIAHRLSTLQECDFKLEFKNGKVIKHD